MQSCWYLDDKDRMIVCYKDQHGRFYCPGLATLDLVNEIQSISIGDTESLDTSVRTTQSASKITITCTNSAEEPDAHHCSYMNRQQLEVVCFQSTDKKVYCPGPTHRGFTPKSLSAASSIPIIKRAALPELPEEENLNQVRCSKTDQEYQCWYHRGGTKVEYYSVETDFDWKWVCPGLCENCLARSADIVQPPAPKRPTHDY